MSNRNLVGVVHNPSVPAALVLAQSLLDRANLGDDAWVCSSIDIDRLVSEKTLQETLVIFTIGGDGTILSTARIASQHSVPIVGINMGRVGFMTELTIEDVATEIPKYLDGSKRVEKRLMLRATVFKHDEMKPSLTIDALNDVVVSRAEARLLDVHVDVDGASLYTYRADGLITATPTGSTGYALSAGGPIVYPEAQIIQIQPLAAHLSFQTGLVVSQDSVIKVTIGEDQAVLTVDGFADTTLCKGDSLNIQRSPFTARFLRAAQSEEFFSRLTEKLGIRSLPLSQS